MGRTLSARLVMDTTQAAEQLSAFGQNVRSITAQLETLSSGANAVGRAAFGLGPSTNFGPIKAQIDTISQSYLKLGETIKTVSRLSTTFNTGRFDKHDLPITASVITGQQTKYAGNIPDINKAQDQLTKAYEAHAVSEQKVMAVEATKDQMVFTAREASAKAIDGYKLAIEKAQARQNAATSKIDALNAQRTAADEAVVAAQEKVRLALIEEAQMRVAYSTGNASQADFIRSTSERQLAEAELTAAVQSQTQIYKSTAAPLATQQRALTNALQAETDASNQVAAEQRSLRSRVAAISRRLSTQSAAANTALAGTQADITEAEKALLAARTRTPALPSTFQYLSTASPQLLQQLERMGLGQAPGQPRISALTGGDQYVKNLISQDAYEGINIQKDLVREVTRVSGSFRDANGILQNFSAEFDKSGKVITRFGGQLSGVSHLLSQIQRDFTKVIEWTVATTVVFGTLSAAMKEVGNVVSIDSNLRRLSITANLTREQSMKMFNDIADAAIATATPLEEMVKASDDIALATRRAGQSTEDWQQNIVSLSKSVGILTNLAGIDTVKATDLLTSVMKQLNLQAFELPGLLNKITAVAGGQSNAIADISQAMGVMAEAGKQARLSIDQMIGAVQALSQATSKSPDEVATSFKNLVGALQGPAAVKALKAFNIELYDSAGHLKNILDIYGEVADRIKNGVIKPDDVQGLVRALAGGPRRAPDAAALLSVIGDIQVAAQKSANATNEAFLANIKVLDTVQAKFVQVRAEIDKLAVNKFDKVINQITDGLLNLAEVFVKIADAVPPDVIVMAAKFLALVAAVRLMIPLTGLLFGGLTKAATGFGILATEAAIATKSLLGFSAASKAASGATPAGGTPIVGRGLGISALAIGGITAGITAASGGNLGQALGAGLQSAGLTLLMSAPIPQAKALGAALAVVGTGIQFFTEDTKKNTDAEAQNSEQILNSIAAYRQAANDVAALSKSQKDYSNELDTLEVKHKKSAADLEAIQSAQTNWAKATNDLVIANTALADSFDKLKESLKGFDFQGSVDLARSGNLTDAELNKVIEKLTIEIMKRNNPDFKAPSEFKLPGALGSPQATPPGVDISGRTFQSTITVSAEQRRLEAAMADFGVNPGSTKASDVKLNDSFAHTDANVKVLNEDLGILQTYFKDSPDLIKGVTDALAGFQTDTTAAQSFNAELRNIVDTYNAWLDARQISDPLFTPEQYDNAKKFLQLYEQLSVIAHNATTLGGQIAVAQTAGLPGEHASVTDANQALIEQGGKNLQDLLNTKIFPAISNPGNVKLTIKDFTDLAKAELQASGNFADIADQSKLLSIARDWADKLHLSINGLNTGLDQTGKQIGATAEEITKAIDDMNKSINSEEANAAGKIADAYKSLHDGSLKGDKVGQQNANANLQYYEAEYSALERLKKAYQELAQYHAQELTDGNAFSSLTKEAGQFTRMLSKLPGLQDAMNLSTQDLQQRLFSLADSFGFSGKMITQLGKYLSDLMGGLDAVNRMKVKFNIGANVDVKGALAALKAVYQAQLIADKAFRASGQQGPTLTEVYNSPANDLYKAIKALEAAQGINSMFASVGSSGYTPRTSTGGGGGGGGGSKQKFNVSTLDLPDVIANSASRSALIQKAIQMAKELQSKIPGATKDAKNDIVELLKGTQRILEVRGVKDDYLRKALEELAAIEQKRLDFETKADTIRRIRVGQGDFTGIANVPVNSVTGVSVGSPTGPITINIALSGQVLTPAQFQKLADQIAAALKKQIAG